jgi:uncharacterized protein YdeI (YjbR/CyaY-like superfamily)
VNATFDGVPYRGSLAPMGGGHMLGILKAVREQIGKQIGDTVKVTVERDTEERTVEVPEDFQKALNRTKGVRAAFEKLAFTHKKEYVRWIEDAKKSETRTARITKAVSMIAEGKNLS